MIKTVKKICQTSINFHLFSKEEKSLEKSHSFECKFEGIFVIEKSTCQNQIHLEFTKLKRHIIKFKIFYQRNVLLLQFIKTSIHQQLITGVKVRYKQSVTQIENMNFFCKLFSGICYTKKKLILA